jgi:hypothetical protein
MAQVAITTDGSSPDNFEMLEVISTDKASFHHKGLPPSAMSKPVRRMG